MRGSVVKRGKTYSIVYDLGKDDTGKRIQKWEGGFPSKRQAEKELRARIDEVESSFARKLDRSTISVYLQKWLSEYCEVNLARNTINGYRVNIEKHIIPYIGQVPLYKLEPSHITAMYVKLREKGLSSTSILYVHRVLRCALNAAVKQRILNNNALNFVDAPRKEKFHPNVLNQDGILRLLEACQGSEIYVPVAMAVLLGLRRGETLGLMWSDIDWTAKTIEIKRTATFYKQEFCLSEPKTANSNRTLLMPDAIIEILKAHRQKQGEQANTFGEGFNPHNLINCRADGLPMTSTVLNNQYRKILKDAGLPPLRFHDLRHTNATFLLRGNIPAKIVSSMLGHSNIGTTMDIYSHVLTEMQTPAAELINSLLK